MSDEIQEVPLDQNSILKRLADDGDGRVFAIFFGPAGFRLEEQYDCYYYLDLTADELEQLGHEIIAVSKLVPPK